MRPSAGAMHRIGPGGTTVVMGKIGTNIVQLRMCFWCQVFDILAQFNSKRRKTNFLWDEFERTKILPMKMAKFPCLLSATPTTLQGWMCCGDGGTAVATPQDATNILWMEGGRGEDN